MKSSALFASLALLVGLNTHAASSYFCIQNSLEPNAVYMMVADSSMDSWSQAYKITANTKVKNSDFKKMTEIIYNMGDDESELAVYKEADLTFENIYIRSPNTYEKSTYNYAMSMGPNNAISIWTSPTAANNMASYGVLKIYSTQFDTKSNKTVQVEGWTPRNTSKDSSMGIITQKYCGSERND